jgi:hypothetical protein
VTKERTSAATSSLRLARKVVVAVIGLSVLGFGVALIVLPGPAVVVIPIGLAILATEFLWAGKSLARMRALLLSLQARGRQMLDRPAKSVAPQSSDLPICSSGSQRANKPSSCSRPRSRRRTSAKKRGRSVSEAQSPARVAPDQIFSAGEELAHSVTHGVGLLLAIAALVLMVVFAARIGSVLVFVHGGSCRTVCRMTGDRHEDTEQHIRTRERDRIAGRIVYGVRAQRGTTSAGTRACETGCAETAVVTGYPPVDSDIAVKRGTQDARGVGQALPGAG